MENEKIAQGQRVQELEHDNHTLTSQVQFQEQRFNELEQVVQQERRHQHEYELQIQDLQRQHRDAKSEADRNKLRVESLQQHIENYTKYGVTAKLEESLESSVAGGAGGQSQTEYEQIKSENDQLKEYLNQYEQQIKDMENELKNLK